MKYVEGLQQNNMGSGSSIDIVSMSLQVKLYTYVLRPGLLKSHNFFTLSAAIDDLILLYLFIVGGYELLKIKVVKLTVNRKFM